MHPPAVVLKRQERDFRFILPLLADLTEAQYGLLMMFQLVAVEHASTALPPLLDSDVADAAAAVAATLETAGRGIIYEHHAATVPAQRLANEFGRAFADLQKESGAAGRTFEGHAILALRRLEQAARTAAQALEGDEPPVYLGLARRMIETAGREPGPERPESGAEDASNRESRRILP